MLDSLVGPGSYHCFLRQATQVGGKTYFHKPSGVESMGSFYLHGLKVLLYIEV